mmetsp:Transcript_22614/g.52680  ORF Transcript_22614/g.52680 Transcript_22614/m.52680 type:complete len:323 (-) Transcript_22614:89-1057(-)
MAEIAVPELKDFVKTASAGLFPSPASDIQTVQADATLRDAFAFLMEQNVLGGPVRGADGKLVGMVDVLDLVAVVMEVMADENLMDQDAHKQAIFERKFRETLADTFTTQTIDSVLKKSGRNNLVVVDKDASLREVVELLGQGNHRIVITDGDKMINIITQSAMVRLLGAHQDKLGELGTKTVRELGMGTAPVITVQNSDSASHAFSEIRRKGVSAVAVVEKGSLVGTISARDIRTVCRTISNTRLLFGSVHNLLAKIHEDDTVDRFPAITVTPDCSFATVVQKMVLLKVHRLWVAESNGGQLVPQRVISLGDVLKEIARVTQ